MNKVEASFDSGKAAELEPIVQLWMMRILVPLGGHREFIGSTLSVYGLRSISASPSLRL